MKRKISWTTKLDDGVKQEIRVDVNKNELRWQRKRADEDSWTYDFSPIAEEWDSLEEILKRRVGRGRAVDWAANIHKLRQKAGC